MFILKSSPMIFEDAMKVSYWKYEEPYSMYSLNVSFDNLKILMCGDYYSVKNTENILVGYYCIGNSARVHIGKVSSIYNNESFMDLSLGLKPDLIGKGLGYEFVKSILFMLKCDFPKKKIRCTIDSFNKSAIKICNKLGFRETDRFSKFTGKGKIEYIVMVMI